MLNLEESLQTEANVNMNKQSAMSSVTLKKGLGSLQHKWMFKPVAKQCEWSNLSFTVLKLWSL